MGNTSVNTACNPRFFRRDCGTSAWRNSLYELVCNSIRLGGAMISLILPKLILSVTRDGILTFDDGRQLRRTLGYSETTEGKAAHFKSRLAESQTAYGGSLLCYPVI